VTGTELDRERFAEAGADLVGALRRALEGGDLPPVQREIYELVADFIVDLTARWVRVTKDADEADAVLYGHGPGVIVAALRKNLTPGQLAIVARMLTE
jgi:hypothetical protein